MESGKERRARRKAEFAEQYVKNGGSPIPPYDIQDFYRLCAKQQRQMVRFMVMQLLTVGIKLEDFYSLARDPFTWMPVETSNADDEKPTNNQVSDN